MLVLMNPTTLFLKRSYVFDLEFEQSGVFDVQKLFFDNVFGVSQGFGQPDPLLLITQKKRLLLAYHMQQGN